MLRVFLSAREAGGYFMHRIMSAIAITRNAAIGVIMSGGTSIIPPPCNKKGRHYAAPAQTRRSPYARSRYLYRRPLAVLLSQHTTFKGSFHSAGSPNMEIIWMAERITPFEEET